MSTPQDEFDFLMPPGNSALISPDAAAKSLARGLTFVYDMIAEAKLEAHAPEGREKKRYTITRRSLALLHAEQALYVPSDLDKRLIALLRQLNARQLTALIVAATQRRAGL